MTEKMNDDGDKSIRDDELDDVLDEGGQPLEKAEGEEADAENPPPAPGTPS